MKSELSKILNKNKIQNIACIGFFANYPVIDYYLQNTSALIFGKSDNLWAHISSASQSDVSTLLKEHHARTKYYFSVEDWMIPLILDCGEADWIMTTNRYILKNNVSIEIPKIKISPIDTSFVSYIYENSDYQKYTSVEYIADRLTRDISAGIWLNKKLVAWGFTHDDGALGFLHVVAKERKKGYGIEILEFLINKRLESANTVFVNIVPENTPAINLIKKLGFSFDRKTSWIKLK